MSVSPWNEAGLSISAQTLLDSSLPLPDPKGRGLHSIPFPLNFSLLCPFPLNLSLFCPPHDPNRPVGVSRGAQVKL